MTPELLTQIGTIIGAVLTIGIFSYLIGDNFLYRIAIHIFIGAAAAFVLIASVESVIIPWLNLTILAQPFQPGRAALGLAPLITALLLLMKGSPRYSRLGDLGLVTVIAVGSAIALWGAVNGTIIPLIQETARTFKPANVFNGFIVLVGTITVLLYFTYIGVRRQGGQTEQILPVRLTGRIGQAFIAVTLGATYALLILSSLTVLTSVIGQRLLALR